MFFTQSFAIGIVLIWSMVMLSTAAVEERNRDLFVSLLSTCLGVFLPQPHLSLGSPTPLMEQNTTTREDHKQAQ